MERCSALTAVTRWQQPVQPPRAQCGSPGIGGDESAAGNVVSHITAEP
jgi:hypothetical protein